MVELECLFLKTGTFKDFFDLLWTEVIAPVGLTWQAAYESVATFSIFGITPPLRLSPTLFGPNNLSQ